MRQFENDMPEMNEYIGMAIKLCNDYWTNEKNEIESYNEQSYIDDVERATLFWFTKAQLVKLKKYVSNKRKRRVVNKDFFDEVLQVAKKFHPITAGTYSWEEVWLTKEQLKHLINFCIV